MAESGALFYAVAFFVSPRLKEEREDLTPLSGLDHSMHEAAALLQIPEIGVHAHPVSPKEKVPGPVKYIYFFVSLSRSRRVCAVASSVRHT